MAVNESERRKSLWRKRLEPEVARHHQVRKTSLSEFESLPPSQLVAFGSKRYVLGSYASFRTRLSRQRLSEECRRSCELNPLSNLTTTFAVRIPRGCHRCECLGRSRPDSRSPIRARTSAPSIRSPLALRRCPRENSGRQAVQETSAAPRCGGGDAVDPTTSRAAPAAAARRRSSGASRSRAPAAGPWPCLPGSAPQRACRRGRDPNQSQTCR